MNKILVDDCRFCNKQFSESITVAEYMRRAMIDETRFNERGRKEAMLEHELLRLCLECRLEYGNSLMGGEEARSKE